MKHVVLGLATALFCATAGLAADVTGTTSATFVNPQPGTATTTGIGTGSITWGAGGSPANSATFTGTSFSAPVETAFKVGTLNYFNGSVNGGTSIGSIDLSIDLIFTSLGLPTVTSVFALDVISTDNLGDPDGDADYMFFPSSFSSTTFDIGGTTYNVKLTGFSNIVGDGFLTSDSTQLHVRENASAKADLFAVVTTETAVVPEPATWAMFIGGFGLVGGAMRRRRTVGVRFA